MRDEMNERKVYIYIYSPTTGSLSLYFSLAAYFRHTVTLMLSINLSILSSLCHVLFRQTQAK